MSKQTPVSELTYDDALSELERLVAELDAGSVDVDLLAQRFSRAVEIAENLEARINRAKVEVEKLAPRLEAVTPEED